MSYTKGPWTTFDVSDGKKEKFSIVHWGPIAYVGDNGNSLENIGNTEANAHLIAAAPDALDRLKDTNAALINWKRLIENKENGVTKTEETIAYNCGLIILENAKIIAKSEGRE
jgi:hypothetical protein